jgi:hypothetical protein
VEKAAVQMESFASMLEREGDMEDYFPKQIPGF